MSEYAWLKTPLHKNMFKDDILDEAVMENIKMSFDGSIMAVKRSIIEKDYEEQGVKMMILGYKKVPRDLKVTDSDSLYKFLALHVDLDEE
jgi:hypothetical protein